VPPHHVDSETHILESLEEETMSLNRMTVAVAMLAAVGALLTAGLAPAQDLHPSRRPSPMGLARTHVGDAYIHVVYSRPYERGRDNIFGTQDSGALVPWGVRWRLGANESVELAVNKDVMFAGKRLPAGIYSVFATPGEKEWTFHVNSALGLFGAGFARNPESGQLEDVYDPENNVVEVTVPVHTIPKAAEGEDDSKVDQFTISFEKPKEGEGTEMVLRWIYTEVRVPIQEAE
jgi:hypothetical protein